MMSGRQSKCIALVEKETKQEQNCSWRTVNKALKKYWKAYADTSFKFQLPETRKGHLSESKYN